MNWKLILWIAVFTFILARGGVVVMIREWMHPDPPCNYLDIRSCEP